MDGFVECNVFLSSHSRPTAHPSLQTNTDAALALPSTRQLKQWEEHVRAEIKRLLEDAEAKEVRVARFESDLKLLKDQLADVSDTLRLKEELKAELLR